MTSMHANTTSSKMLNLEVSHTVGATKLRFFLLALGLFFCLASPVATAKVVEMDNFKDWSVYRDDSGAERLCYMSSVPKKAAR